VWELHNLALNQVGAHAGNGPWDDDLHNIDEVYLKSGGEFLVGCLAGRVVAMGALKRTGERRAQITRMRVHPECQRRGFGQAILSLLEERARELGYHQLHLDTTVQQTAAQELYLKNGYRQTGRTRYGRFEVLLFEKELCGPTRSDCLSRP
jgi:ribosomal protein S18 acetylase RimI-like enzyme